MVATSISENPLQPSPPHFAWVGSVLDFGGTVERRVLVETWSHSLPYDVRAEIWNDQIAVI